MPYTLTFGSVPVTVDTVDEVEALLERLSNNGRSTRKAKGDRRDKRSTDDGGLTARLASPGSLEARIVAHVRSHGEIKPGVLAEAMNVDAATSRRAVAALVKAGRLKAKGTTMSRRITLAK